MVMNAKDAGVIRGIPQPRAARLDYLAEPTVVARGYIPAPRAPQQPAPTHRPTAVSVRVTVARPTWQRTYSRVVATTDLGALLVSLLAHRLWGGVPSFAHGRLLMGLSVLLAGALVLGSARAWDTGVLGHGTEEFTRLCKAFIWLGVLVGLAGLALKAVPLRPYAFGVVPIALALALAARLAVRGWIGRLRRSGRCTRNVLVVGSARSVAQVIERARRARRTGWSVTGVCLAGPGQGARPTAVGEVPVIGGPDDIVGLVLRFGYHVVCIAPDAGRSPRALHQLAWDLEGSGAEIVVDPGLMEITGPRLQVHTIDGFPMLRLAEPTFQGAARTVKAITDRLGAALLLVLLSPVMLVVAIAVALDGGPVFFRQQRIGRSGEAFTMLKFRSMVVDADWMRAELAEQNQGAGPLFKLHDDPRVTRVGRVLRRYSLDELPQLFNVLTGSMSLVGPRPPLAEEVANYDREARRRLLVRPGMTGMWQISGRSDLSWEDTVRLDRNYVENWSLLTDALIVLRTVRVVVRGSGAY
jgi:exopolysaccharide biosynthesis polyprenyl glycosylphosphotransferase